ncbi:hypothetical protein M3Y97_00785700 [Aphelenchoides bicaudatus]|nr:hypothetical protein M3Y97_00785700 [Aphelenchoides bicaudatus]
MPGFDWTSDDMAAAGSWFLHEAYQIYLKTSFDLDRKQKKVVVFDKPNKWHIKLSKKSLVEKQIYTGKELMKKSNPKDARYVKLPSNLTADQITQVLALLSSGDHDLLQLLKEKNDEKEPDQKRQRLN